MLKYCLYASGNFTYGTFIVEIFCNKVILTVDMIRATCLQNQAKHRKIPIMLVLKLSQKHDKIF
jgi:hypothetical protein